MTIRSTMIVGDELVVVWNDGHESYFPLPELRKACPCAFCAGEPDLFGRVARPEQPPLRPESFQLARVSEVGRYGLQLEWADRHVWGIWTLERLRAFCPCCRSNG